MTRVWEENERRPALDRKAGLLISGALRRKKRIQPMSKKRRSELIERAKVRGEVFTRDGNCILRYGQDIAGPCVGRLTPHHLLKASQGGDFTPDNLVTLCVGHNDWVEDNPVAARGLGLVRYSWEAS